MRLNLHPHLLAMFAAFALLCSPLVLAHDLPGKVTVLLHAKPQDEQLLVLMRVPMDALSEVQFPLRGTGFLDLDRIDAALADAARIYLIPNLRFHADGAPVGNATLLKARVTQWGDKSFAAFDSAMAHLDSPPLTNADELYWKQAFLDVLIAYPIASAQARFSLDADLERLGLDTHTVLHFLPPGRPERVFDYSGDAGLVQLEPGWWHAFSRFVLLGFKHILEGLDHLLFLLCLVIPARSVRTLVPVITAFTLAHSITLISSAFGVTPTALWFPPLIETLIALSVFYMACENLLGAKLDRRWMIVFCFGLVHGFGFSFILAERMQFAGAHLISALLAFNVGVELGQLLVLTVTVPLLRWCFSRLPQEKIGIVILSAIAAHSAWHWFTERGAQLLQYRWEWPTLDAAFFAAAMRWLMLIVASAGLLWALSELFKRFARSRTAAQDST